jgi:hypothetical protein
MVSPPITKSFTFTLITVPTGTTISILEPNFIIPNLSPTFAKSPTLTGQTILLATAPAICLKKTLILLLLIPR